MRPGFLRQKNYGENTDIAIFAFVLRHMYKCNQTKKRFCQNTLISSWQQNLAKRIFSSLTVQTIFTSVQLGSTYHAWQSGHEGPGWFKNQDQYKYQKYNPFSLWIGRRLRRRLNLSSEYVKTHPTSTLISTLQHSYRRGITKQIFYCQADPHPSPPPYGQLFWGCVFYAR